MKDACERYGIHRQTLWRWLKKEELAPERVQDRQRKIDVVALKQHVEDHPDMIIRERAAAFGVYPNAIWYQLKKLGITKKNDTV